VPRLARLPCASSLLVAVPFRSAIRLGCVATVHGCGFEGWEILILGFVYRGRLRVRGCGLSVRIYSLKQEGNKLFIKYFRKL